MAGKARVLGIVLAGGEGKRLLPLTADRAKPAVPFGGTYRLIDFVLSNMVNAGFMKICVLTQYKSHSLDRHISKAWQLSDLIGNYVTPVPAQQRLGPRWYSGSADAIFQSMNLIDDERPDYVVVFGADHVYRMDPSQMLRDHIASGAGVTVAGIRVPRDQADQFGVISTNDGRRISEFLEKPKNPPGLPDSPDEIFASMGNYIFTTKTLQETLALDAADEGSLHDMGGNIIPSLVEANDAAVYDFRENDVPGSTDRDRGYWRDVGTIDAYHDAHMDLVSIEPVFNLYNLRWPMLTSQPQLPGAKFVENPRVHASIVAPGVIISGGSVDHSVLSPQVRVRHGAHVSGSVLMDNVDIGAGARVERAILDKNVIVPPGAQVGVDHRVDLARGYTVSAGGITIVGKNQKIDP